MDTAKHKALRLESDEETTGIFRRPDDLPRLGGDAEERAPEARLYADDEQDAESKLERPGTESGERRASMRRAANRASARPDEDLHVTTLQTRGFGKVAYDAKGDPVFEWRVKVPRRREDDPTVDLLKCLDLDGLRLEDDADERDRGINPYDTATVKIRR
ncbi:MAG TPA: hypothetical protein VFV10_20555 [Gammaproteobacteria bacterium]|nr:hypothetical protein [Gammaproteobacteria bacterium]